MFYVTFSEQKKIIDCLKQISKPYKFKGSYRTHGIYKISSPYLWRLRVIPHSSSIRAEVNVGAAEFDELYRDVIFVDQNIKLLESARVDGCYVGPTINLLQKDFVLLNQNYEITEGTIENVSQLIWQDASHIMESFQTKVENFGGLNDYLTTNWKDYPYEAGLSYLLQDNLLRAEECFLYVDQVNINLPSIGSYGRYVHYVYLDYCKAKRMGISWKTEYVRGGLKNI